MQIAYLADHPQHARQLACWHYAAWGRMLKGWSVDGASAELLSHRQRRAIPTTLVALRGDEAIGSASLLVNDDVRVRDYSPWLASVFVREDQRRSGVGRQLVERATEEAAHLGVERLYLYTTDTVDFYKKLGWECCAKSQLNGIAVTVMAIVPPAALALPALARSG